MPVDDPVTRYARRREKVFWRALYLTVAIAAATMWFCGPMYGVGVALLFAVFTILY